MRYSLLLSFVLIAVCAQAKLAEFNPNDQPPAPDYSLEKNWSALPFRSDAADKIPKSETWVSDSLKAVDVFYIYPTMYMSGKTWNADLSNKKLNKKIDNKPVRYQASVFNASCRVYAPRYRQSGIKAFFTLEGEGKKSLAFAYDDVKRAFEYYLKHYNNGRPIIIASHSQGTYHSRRLLQEFFDGTQLKDQLVCAYSVGFAIDDTMYKKLKPCETPHQTECFVTWASFRKGYEPLMTNLAGNVCVNPISWNCDTVAIDKSKSVGGILLNFNKSYKTGAQIYKNYLWVKTKIPFVRSFTNMHIADYNLFWFDIRKNVSDRVKAYLNR